MNRSERRSSHHAAVPDSEVQPIGAMVARPRDIARRLGQWQLKEPNANEALRARRGFGLSRAEADGCWPPVPLVEPSVERCRRRPVVHLTFCRLRAPSDFLSGAAVDVVARPHTKAQLTRQLRLTECGS